MKYTGLILKEGLQDETVLQQILITNIEIWDAENAEGDQPKQWTAVSFEIEKEKADQIAEIISKSLKPKYWYVTMSGEDNIFVIFPNKIFKYKKGDMAKRAEAIGYGKTAGVPESQLDWGE